MIGWLICHFSTLKNSLTLAIACLNTTFAFAPRLVVIANLTPTLITYPSLILIASVNILYCERYVFKFLLNPIFDFDSDGEDFQDIVHIDPDLTKFLSELAL